MRSFQGITDAITAFKACRGVVTAKDANTGAEAQVEALEDFSDGMARLLVRLKGRQVRFEAAYVNGPGSLGSYFNVKVHRPEIPDCEPTAIEILHGGHEDYPVHAHGSGSREPVLALTLVNEGAEKRNAPIVAAYRAELQRLQEEKARRDREEGDRREAERLAGIKACADKISPRLAGKRVQGVEIEAYASDQVTSLTLKLEDGTSVKIRSRHDNCLEIE